MRLLRLAVEKKRWDLAAHTIVLAAARQLKEGGKPDVQTCKEEKRRSGGQSKR
jgi:hypothetical protein